MTYTTISMRLEKLYGSAEDKKVRVASKNDLNMLTRRLHE